MFREEEEVRRDLPESRTSRLVPVRRQYSSLPNCASKMTRKAIDGMNETTKTAVWRAFSLLILLLMVLVCQNGPRSRRPAVPLHRGPLQCLAADDAAASERGRILTSHLYEETAITPAQAVSARLIGSPNLSRRESVVPGAPFIYLRCMLFTQVHSTTI